MVTGRIVNYDPDDQHLRTAGRACRAADPRCRAQSISPSTMQWMAVLGKVEDQIVECFHTRRRRALRSVSSLPRSDGRGKCSDRRRRADRPHPAACADGLADQLERGIDVLDIGCGSGRAVCLLAAEFPEQPIRRLRPVRRRRRRRQRRGQAPPDSRTFASKRATSRSSATASSST